MESITKILVVFSPVETGAVESITKIVFSPVETGAVESITKIVFSPGDRCRGKYYQNSILSWRQVPWKVLLS